MRLNCVLLVAAAALAATLDGTLASSGPTLSELKMKGDANIKADIRNGARWLRTHSTTTVGEEEEEERVWGFVNTIAEGVTAGAKIAKDHGTAAKILAQLAGARTVDDMGPILKKVDDPRVAAILMDKVETHAQNLLPGFSKNMEFGQFDELLQASTLSDDIKLVLTVAFSKYIGTKSART